MWLRLIATSAVLVYTIAVTNVLWGSFKAANVLAIIACLIALGCGVVYWRRKRRRDENKEGATVALVLIVMALIVHGWMLTANDGGLLFFGPMLIAATVLLVRFIDRYDDKTLR